MAKEAPSQPTRRRADAVLAKRGFAESRARARAAIEAGGVRVDGRVLTRASDLINPDADITFRPAFEEVSRAAGKLKAAPGFDGAPLEGAVVLDVGASTGGFTEVCLGRGARRVYAVDVGRDQLHPRLRADPRVVSLEGLDARRLDASLIPEAPDVVVCDTSFISLSKVLPAALSLAAPGAWLFALVKPQFEVGPDKVGKGGVVRDPSARASALHAACDFLETSGWRVTGRTPSPVTGADGNVEFLVSARKA
ncbi:MAG: TlyA family RNA methyltransferase [Phenylobacterium sp.]